MQVRIPLPIPRQGQHPVSERVQGIRGMNDILPDQTSGWRHLEALFSRCVMQYGYREIRLPIVENTRLFKRTIGEVTDIVEKEMYTFQDLNEDSLTLRPEGTAGCVRACIEHGLLYNQSPKLWYAGPMFRHERPQKGRYRQFNQFGVEAFGIPGVGIELELLSLCQRFWTALGVHNAVHLEINSMGEPGERQAYRALLVEYLQDHIAQLDEDSKRRLEKNPLRILDSKHPAIQSLLQNAPKLMDSLGETSKQLFSDCCAGLDTLGIPYKMNPYLVRGLDYYGHLVFEWVTDKLGSQSTVCAGGRYNTLVELLGGSPTPAVGFAMGCERLLLLMDTLSSASVSELSPTLFMIADGPEALEQSLQLAEWVRDKKPWQVLVNTLPGSFKSQFRKADKSGAQWAVILGPEELKQKTVSIKNLREVQEQITIPQSELIHYLESYLG